MPLIPARAIAPLPPVELDRDRVQAVMAKVRQLEIRTRGLVTNSLAGGYQAAFRGRGIDFDQVREYVAGDEVRTIDWNVTARAGRPFVKQFREERELALMLVVDVSASSEFGSKQKRKREVVAELACVLALSAIRNNDLVGLVMFSDRIERFVPAAKGRAHALRIVREILSCKPDGTGTDVALALELAGAVSRRRAVIALISDLEIGAPRAGALENLTRAARPVGLRHDVVALRVRDPHERSLPKLGLLALEDAETGEVVYLDTARRKVRDRFAELARQRADELRKLLAAANVDVLEVDTAEAFIPTLQAFFARRHRRPR
ncbi:DUF58 domain-containing protein [soil metagenome]